MFKAREHCVRQRTSTQDTANANYMLLTIVVTGHNCVAVVAVAVVATQHVGMLRPSTYDDDAVYV